MATSPLLNDDQIRPPNTVRPVVSSDEILGHIDRAMSTLPPEAHDAIGQAHTILGVNAPPVPAEQPFTDGIKPARMGGLPDPPVLDIQSPGAPSPMGQINLPRGSVPRATMQPRDLPPPTEHQSELARITAPPLSGPQAHTRADTGRSGVDQIHNPYARVPLQILDAVGRGLFPGIEMGLPGTSGHHDVLVHQAGKAVDEDTAQRVAVDESRLKTAQTENQEALPELNRTKAELASTKESNAVTAARNKEDIERTKNEGTAASRDAQRRATLASHGFEEDEKGNIVPLPYERMSQEQQAVHDLKASQSEAAEASAALKKAQAENQPTLVRLAQQRLISAQESHRIAAERLGLSEQQFEMRAYGTGAPPPAGPAHQPLPGTLITDSGDTVGTANAPNVRPTATERSRADLAGSAQEQLQDMRSIVKAHPEFFGPGAGRASEFATWVGSEDPEAKRFATARSILADHASGVFGARSEYASKAQEIASGQYKDNPAAILTGLEQIEKAMHKIGDKGTPRTTGSDAGANAIPHINTTKEYEALKPGATFIDAADGKPYKKPEAKKK